MLGTAKQSIFRRTVMKAAALILAASVVAGTAPLSAKAQTSTSPYQQPAAGQSAYPYGYPYPYYYPYYYPYWAYAYPWGWGWPVGVSVAFGGCFNCGFRGAFFRPGFGRFGFAHPAFFHPGFGRFGFAHPGFFHPGFGHFGFAHGGFGGGFHGGGHR
jgi:hypothetical protein